MDELEEIKVTFFQECEELLADLESGLSAMHQGVTDGETINAVFRAVHSIKGGAGAFGLDPLVRFAHVFETLLDDVRSNKVAVTSELVRELLRAADVLADHVQAARSGGVADTGNSERMAATLNALSVSSGASMAAETSGSMDFSPAPVGDLADLDDIGGGFRPMTVALPDLDEPGASAAKTWTIHFRPQSDLYRKANDSSLLLRELARLGEMSVAMDDSVLPLLDTLDPLAAYLTWTVTLSSVCEEAAIHEVFEFVDGDCDITISVDVAETSALEAPTSDASPPDVAALIAASMEAPAAAPPAPGPAPVPVIAKPEPIVPVAAAAPPPAPVVENPSNAQATIRVDPERIDRLIDLVGELVINQAMLAQRMTESGLASSSNVAMGLDELEQLTREIQDGVMAIRAQPVKAVFQRMPRLVREVAAMTKKNVRLVTEGEATEVDKTVIERLGEPITHMIRNAIDHGLETPDERLAAGKPAEGTVKLAALHRGGRIVIEVHDDGRGINRQRVLAIAQEKELVAPDAVLTDDEIDNLIFMPGFSTADAVSDISGRGVGMDVVRRSVQALGGRISISSRPGEGSTFTLSLPLTLAVLDGMVVDVAGQTLVVPLTAIIESLRPKPEDIKPLGPQGAVLSVRDSFVPLIDIAMALGFRADSRSPAEGVVLLIEGEDGARAALVADTIQGQRQVVIKSLETNYRQVEGIAAATILGDGRVALIVDVDAIVAMRRRDGARAPRTHPFRSGIEP